MIGARQARAALRELSWLAPFVFLGLAALALLRPEPVVPPARYSGRVMVDAGGTQVRLPVKVKSIYGGNPAWYLELTHSPETLALAGRPGDQTDFAMLTMGRVFPSVLRDSALWRKRDGTLESVLAEDRDYTYFIHDPSQLRRFGLNAITWWGRADIFSQPNAVPGWDGMEMNDWDKYVLNDIYIFNRALGQEKLAEWLAADYAAGYRSLAGDLKPDTVQFRPRTLTLIAPSGDWSKLIVMGGNDGIDQRRGATHSAAQGWNNTGRLQEAERVLAMNPDIIFSGEPVDDFRRDPRWRGLKATHERRVYNGPLRDFHHGTLIGITYDSLWARWSAEITHPERMPGGLRGRLRAHLEKLYGYRLSETEMDELLNVAANHNSVGYERFRANGEEVTK